MKRTLALGLAAALIGGAAYAQAVYVFDPGLGETFEVKREVVDTIKRHYDNDIVHSSGNNLPPEIASEIKPGEPLPAGAEVEDLPGDVAADMPHSMEGSRWVEVGEHLIELGPDDRALVVVYDVVR